MRGLRSREDTRDAAAPEPCQQSADEDDQEEQSIVQTIHTGSLLVPAPWGELAPDYQMAA
jgi:hypothetical protein